VKVVDTSVLVGVERRDALSLSAVAELLQADDVAVSVVTAHELLRSERLPPAWRAFWSDFLDTVRVLDLSREAAEAAAGLWAARPNRNERPDVGDVLIAGTAEAEGLPLVTADAGILELVPGAELLRPS
jgi:predicted nucleic acid-binding protein